MSHWNQTPLELAKWKPRPPSPELRARIFGGESLAVEPESFDLRQLTRWIVPALGCFLLVMATLSERLHPRPFSLASTNFSLPALTDEATAMAVPPSMSHGGSGVNGIPVKTMEWSFGGPQRAAAIGSFLISYTNKLIQ